MYGKAQSTEKNEKYLIVSDLDGTLLSSNKTITSECMDTLSEIRARGWHFTFATGRSYKTAKKYIDLLDINIPVILYNGAQIYAPIGDEYLLTHFIGKKEAAEVLQILDRFGLHPIVHSMNNENEFRVYFSRVTNESEQYYLNTSLSHGDERFRITPDYAEIPYENVIEIMVYADSRKKNQIEKELANLDGIHFVSCRHLVRDNFYLIEITETHSNKGNALQFIKRSYPDSTTICFGDNNNDISLFQEADFSIAVENSVDELKSIAHFVCQSNDENGVGKFLKDRYLH